jgi:cytochrome c-type biogenesis protein CcmE
VVAAVGFVLVRGLGDATLFFYNVDEAVGQRATLEDRRFRLQGNVVDGSVSRTAAGADFTVTYNGVEATVRHQGDLPQLFQPGIPVVLEGAWDGERFASDRMLVKHSEVYTAEHPDRVDGYDAPAGEGGARSGAP